METKPELLHLSRKMQKPNQARFVCTWHYLDQILDKIEA